MDHNSLDRIVHLVETKMGLKSQLISLLIWQDNIKERMDACHLLTYEEYEKYLKTSSKEMQALIEIMVNSETWFFREQGAFDYLTYLIKRGKIQTPYLKVLSLACSTGEEPYSIVMTLFDAGLSEQAFRVDATDISSQALNKAKAGLYQENAFRKLNLHLRDRYFDLTNSGYAIHNKIKKQVLFYECNILEEKGLFQSQSYHVIFCRNLLIYLHQNAQIELLKHMKDLLVPKGILIVGSAETKIVRALGFEPVLFSGVNAFILKG